MGTLATLAQWRFGAAAAYLVGFLVVVRAVVAVIRIKTHPRAEIGLVVLIAIAILFALVPYSIQLHLNDYRDFGYSSVQATNWLWTLREIGGGNVPTYVVTLIGCLSSLGFIVSLLWTSQLVLPRRTATPDRVLLEKQA